jgi:arabinose-5-phosphate isomerase
MHTGEEIPRVSAETTLRDSVVKMSRGGFGALVVCTADDSLLGVFTDGDLRRYFEKSPACSLEIAISEVMTKKPRSTSPERLAWKP